MAQIDRIYELHTLFTNHHYAINTTQLASLLECSIPTVKRYIAKLKNEYGVPLRYDFKHQGYILDKTDTENIQFPGLWFNISELYSLLAMHELLNQLDSGLLKTELQPFRDRIERLLENREITVNELTKRIQFIGIGIRLCCPMAFKIIATATMERKRIKLRYHSRSENKVSRRNVSPQRMIYYRGNWYLAVYCHTRHALRTLALDRMSEIVPQEGECMEVDEAQLISHFNLSFGIFAGRPEHKAILLFSPDSARWVADERWHPNQTGRWLDDGSFELQIPYADRRELMMEILRYGPDVQVLAPHDLQQAVRERLRLALARYGEK